MLVTSIFLSQCFPKAFSSMASRAVIVLSRVNSSLYDKVLDMSKLKVFAGYKSYRARMIISLFDKPRPWSLLENIVCVMYVFQDLGKEGVHALPFFW